MVFRRGTFHTRGDDTKALTHYLTLLTHFMLLKSRSVEQRLSVTVTPTNSYHALFKFKSVPCDHDCLKVKRSEEIHSTVAVEVC